MTDVSLYVSKQSPVKEPFYFQFIQDAVDFAVLNYPSTDYKVRIVIEPGVYKEKIAIQTNSIRLTGTSSEDCIIVWDDHANKIHTDQTKTGTFRSYTMLLDGNDLTLENLTIQNDAGFGRRVGQAVALYADGDRILVKNCRLLAHQDTLFTGPLPPSAIQKGGFTGPKEFSPRIIGRQVYQNCYIEGDIDFIFGSAVAWFEGCEIYSHCLYYESPIHGYITASSTPEEEPFGYIFHHCRLTGDAPKHSVYLGRPWRNFGKVLFLSCEMGEHIHPEGFHDWGKPESHATIVFGEGNNNGIGSDLSLRSCFTKKLSQKEIEQISPGQILNPKTKNRPYWNPLTNYYAE